MLQQSMHIVLKTGIRNENWLKRVYKHMFQQKFVSTCNLLEGGKKQRIFNCRNINQWHIHMFFTEQE